MNSLEIYALVVVALFLKMVAVVVVQGRYRMKHQVFTKPEDAQKFGDGQVADKEHPVVDRGQRTLRNDLENIPIFLFLAGLYVAFDAWAMGAVIYFSLFLICRIAHTITYLRPAQPWRTLAYAGGMMASMAVAGHVVFEVLIA